MSQLITTLKEKEEVEEICAEHSLNKSVLKSLLFLASKGYNNTELAKKMEVHRVTIQRYCNALRKMKKEDYMRLFQYLSKEIENEAD